jgi:hypothetical protein
VERDERIARFAGTFVAPAPMPDTWPDVRPMLRPVLRPATYALAGPGQPRPVRRPALPFLHELVVVDTPTAMNYVTVDHLADWGVTEAQAFDAARGNLEALPSDLTSPDRPAVVRFVDDGNAYFVSRLLLDGWLAGLEPVVGGRPVAFAPDNNTLIVAALADDALAGLIDVVEQEYREAVRSVSPCPYSVDERGAVVPYAVPGGHPLHGPLSRATGILAGERYGSQAAWLEAQYEHDGTDVFVAQLIVVGRPDGTVFTTATWSRGVDTLLPRADFVALADDDAGVFHVPWSVLEREVDLDPCPDLDPVRYRLTAWPPDGVVDRLRAAATDP